MNIADRLDELRTLQDGWLENRGRALDPAGLDWLATRFDQLFPGDLPLPYLYPTPAGGVQAEWSFHPYEITMEINLQRHSGEWHCMNLESGMDETHTLDLDADAEWERLSDSIRHLPEGSG